MERGTDALLVGNAHRGILANLWINGLDQARCLGGSDVASWHKADINDVAFYVAVGCKADIA